MPDEPAPRPNAALLAATVAWAGSMLYLGLTPRLPEAGPFNGSSLSSWGHALGTMVLAALLFLVAAQHLRVSRAAIAVGVVVAASLFGVGIEVLQAITGERDASFADALLDIGGAVVAVTLLSRPHVVLAWWSRIMTAVAAILVLAVVAGALFATPGEPSTTDCSTSEVAAPRPGADDSVETAPPPLAEYRFDEGSGTRVADVSGASPPLDLELSGTGAKWLPGGGLRFSGGAARSDGSAARIAEAVERTGELTVEAWARSADLDQDGPARIVTVSSGTGSSDVNMHLGEEGGSLSVRLRATCGRFNWTTFDDAFTSRTKVVHVALTFANQVQRVYVDGELVGSLRFNGRLGGWVHEFPLVVGNEATMDRPFSGDVFGVALYDEALAPATIAQRAVARPQVS